MTIKVIKGPDGRFHTVGGPGDEEEKEQQKSLEELHKETRDMIQGNKQFHVDPYAKPVEPEKVDHNSTPFDPDLWMENYGGAV